MPSTTEIFLIALIIIFGVRFNSDVLDLFPSHFDSVQVWKTSNRAFAQGRMCCVSDDGAVDATRISDDAASKWTNELDQLAGILGDGFFHALSITH